MTAQINLDLLRECCAAVTGENSEGGGPHWTEIYPRWLQHALKKGADEVRLYLNADHSLLSPAVARDRLQTLRDALFFIQDEIKDRVIIAYLNHHGEAAGYHLHEVMRMIQDLGSQASEAIARLTE